MVNVGYILLNLQKGLSTIFPFKIGLSHCARLPGKRILDKVALYFLYIVEILIKTNKLY